LLDNRPIFSSLAAVYGLEQLPVSMIERIEVIKGGGSALFGASSIGGVVNIITKEPLANTLSISNTTSITAKGNMDINTALNGSFVSSDSKAGLYLFGMLKNRDGYDHNNDGFTDLPKLESQTIGFRGYYKTSMYSKLTLEYHHIGEYRRGGDLLSLPPHQANIAEQLRHSIDGGGLRFDAYSDNQKHRFQLYLSSQKIKRDSYFGVDKDTNAYGNTNDITAVAGAQYTYSFDNFLISPANLTIGSEFSHNSLEDRFLGFNRNFKQYTNVAGLFLQNEWKTERYNFVLGARLDKHNKINKVIISPRVSFRYGIAPWIDLRCGYSSGYLAPQAYNEDLHVNAMGGDIALIELSKDLKPEYSNSVNISADMYFNMSNLQFNIITEGFYTSIKDVFTLRKDREDINGNIIYVRENSFGAKIYGVNLDVKLGIPKKFDVQLGYTIQNSIYNKPFEWSKDITPQRKMFRSPNQYGHLTSNINLIRQLSLSVFMTYTGKMLVQHNAGYINEDKEILTPDFIDAGFKLSYDFNFSKVVKGTLFTGIKNVFNSFQKDLDYGKLKDASYIYGPSEPRRYFIGMKFMF
jgi:Outer membrane receptor for ferrienterochelin and colicins